MVHRPNGQLCTGQAEERKELNADLLSPYLFQQSFHALALCGEEHCVLNYNARSPAGDVTEK